MPTNKDRLANPASRPTSEFARRLRAARTERRLSQTDLARTFGVQTQTVSQWERSAKHPQPRFYDELISFLRLGSREQLLALFDSPATGAGLVASRGKGRGSNAGSNRLSLVSDAPAVGMSDRQGVVSSDEVIRAALSILDARDSRLSETEAKLVQALLAAAHDLRSGSLGYDAP
jgi:DNA-binding XRE family transcriptional regulator